MQFLKLQYDLITDKNITSNEFRIYTYLLSLYNAEKQCAYPSMEFIAERLNISIATVKRAIKKLVKLGYIAITKKKGINGNFNTYTNLKHLIGTKEDNNEKQKKEDKPKKKFKKAPKIISDCKESGVPAISEYTVKHQQKISLILKQGIKLTKKQQDIIGDMKLEILRQAIRLFKKKKGRVFSFLLNLYLDIAEKNNIEITKDIERYLCGSYIRLTQEEIETQRALMELEIYGVPVF